MADTLSLRSCWARPAPTMPDAPAARPVPIDPRIPAVLPMPAPELNEKPVCVACQPETLLTPVALRLPVLKWFKDASAVLLKTPAVRVVGPATSTPSPLLPA
ncbi:MAG: hypothetical protein ABF446_12500 [Acetobacter orientalis]|uniref:hypothetical protein n=1 Tax=Acetobacter orientalis TaxID=146474 RepID=UPI0039EBC2F0